MLKDASCNYQWVLRRTLEHLLEYQRIDKKEFAYLVYAEEHDIPLISAEYSKTIKAYREQAIDIDIVVEIRNDQDDYAPTKKVDDRYLTAFGYVTNILIQSGIAEKDDGYCILNEKSRCDVSEILGGGYDEKSR